MGAYFTPWKPDPHIYVSVVPHLPCWLSLPWLGQKDLADTGGIEPTAGRPLSAVLLVLSPCILIF